MQRQLLWSILLLVTMGLAMAAPIEIVQSDVDAGTIEVPIELANIQDLSGFNIDVYYDENLLVYDNATLGPLLGTEGQQFFSLAIDTGNQVNGLIAVRTTDTGISGSGVLLTLTFTPLAVGLASVELVDITLADDQASEITIQTEDITIGNGIVIPPVVPEIPPTISSGGGGGGRRGGGGGGAYLVQQEAADEPEENEVQEETQPQSIQKVVPTTQEARVPENTPAGLGITGMAGTPDGDDEEVARNLSPLFVIISIVSTLLVAGVMHRRIVVREQRFEEFRENSTVIVQYIHEMWSQGWTNEHIINQFLEHRYPEQIIIEMMEQALEIYA